MSPESTERKPAQTLAQNPSLYSPLSAIIRRQPVTVAPGATVREALRMMDDAAIGALVITDPASDRPIGIFTLRDLLTRVTLAMGDIEQPIAAVMSRTLITLRSETTAYQAALTMTRHRLRHILVVDHEGRLIGVVSQNDLFALQRVGYKDLGAAIRTAPDVDALKDATREITHLAGNMLSQGIGAEPLTQFVTSLNDLLTLRMIELTLPSFELPKIDWCWIALGSEGRFEQTFTTDQDNGIIFACPGEEAAEPLRQMFLPFARAVNDALDACGFARCKGNIMAGNPEWCLSSSEWRDRFGLWIREAQPQALLNASIFFDFRPLYGEEGLSDSLRSWLFGYTTANPLFLRQMTVNAMQCNPPLGLIRDFTFDRCREFPHSIDLKMFGTRPFVDAARIFSLAHGIADTSTAQRLRALTRDSSA